jgi:hypothetical protein
MEYADPKNAEISLLKDNCTIDAKQGVIFGYPLGTNISDVIKKAGPPAAVFKSKSCEVLYYGGEIELIFKNNELFGVNVKKGPMPDYINEDENDVIIDSENIWDVNGVKYHDGESKVISTFKLEKLIFPPNSGHKFATDKCNVTIIYSITHVEISKLKVSAQGLFVESIFIRNK